MTKPGWRGPSRFRTTKHPSPTATSCHGPLAMVRKRRIPPPRRCDQEKLAQQNRCLAEAIYFEARGESWGGQAAVAQVVLNRVSSGLYPATICGVVYQNRRHYNA